jgi:hypothetical protein
VPVARRGQSTSRAGRGKIPLPTGVIGMLKTAKYSSVLEKNWLFVHVRDQRNWLYTLDKKKKLAVLAVLLGVHPLADNRYSWTGRQSARQNRQQIKPHLVCNKFLTEKQDKNVWHLFVRQLCKQVCQQVCCLNVMVETHLKA